ncbi:hypothetical protein QP919_00535 [Corynebacterium propinquum]|uniref:hypothetical protein n=1 Tax=Corynebacterium propinquum TaxID=43769 RepID=UPI0006663D80|nr:hypothetical protein [Corynebacterium propinquum]MCG7231359.1 hypothetical protein [Corynebacterium propinquum]MDK4235807.1 hypothetical protein [Corynebacterium propinquum]MDK4239071.1 hypothetical protein [Corynebacterium propinquum]MDK4258912.1 hypothetical protein [Corynebacterium propinquum]MDK4283105.1 hypothetical protein [Corynebacterium propinquum]
MLTPETCAQNLTRRILGGAGTLSLVPLDIDATVSIAVAAHGFDHHGQMIIACHVDDVACLTDGRVRLDGIKKALELSTDITIASLHAVAEVEWQAGWYAAQDLVEEPTPFLRFGIVTLDHAHLHWPCGASLVRMAELHEGNAQHTTERIDEFAAREVLDGVGKRRLATLHEEVMAGVTDGLVLSDRTQPMCPHWNGQVWVADVNECGFMLIAAGADRMSVTMVGFASPAESLVNFESAVKALAR